MGSSWPHGRSFGGQLRALHILRALRQVGDVTFTLVGSEAADVESMRRTSAEFATLPPVQPVDLPNRGPLNKLRWAFDTRYLNIHGYVATEPDRQRIMAASAEFDLTWVLNSRTPNILRQWEWPHSHLDIDDVPSTYSRSMAASAPRWSSRWKARVQQYLLYRRERLLRARFTTLSVCSDDDRRYLGGGDEIHVIPNGFERPHVAPIRQPSLHPPRIGFIGLFSYTPNRDGVTWFLKECWPDIQRQVPGIRFRLVGRDTDGALKPTQAAVDALGWVANPAEEIATWSAMVVPIRFGGGTRIKLADGFSRKCPIVATPLGAFGYDVRDGNQLRLAQQPAEFTAACVDLVRNPTPASAMAERAWTEFLEKWTWDAIAPKVWAAAADCLRRGQARRR